MVKFRPTAALTGLISAVAVAVGAFSCPAGARPIPASTSVGRPAVAVLPAAKSNPPAKASTAVLRVAVTMHYGPLANASGYSVIVATSARHAWAFGGTDPGGPSTPVAAQWNGSTLTPVALPRGLTGFISEASAPAPSDIWAGSQYGRYILHWDGRRWLVAGHWRHGQLTGLTAISASDVWAFGTTVTGSRGMGTWHFDGTSWLLVTGSARSVYRASAISHRDIWAIAANRGGDVIVRFDGRTWRRVDTGRVLVGVQPTRHPGDLGP